MRNWSSFSAVVVFVVVGHVSCSRLDSGAAAASEHQESSRTRVLSTTLREQPLQVNSEYLAELVSRHQVAVYSQVVGNVSAIGVKPGDSVKAGDTLLQIDPRRESANLQSLVAARAQKQASLALARSTEERSKRLLSEGLLSQQQYDQDRSLREVAEQELKAGEAAILAQSAQLTFYRISAPFSGLVGDIPVKLGDLVSPTLKLTSIVDNANLEAYVNLPVDRLSLLSDGSLIQVLDAEHRVTAQAAVSFVASEASSSSQSVLVKAVIPNTSSLRAAQLVRVRVVFRSHPGVRVPLSAVTRQSGQYFVFVAEGSGAQTVARQRAIELGDLDNDQYDVLKGLAPGDRVIVSQLQKLRDGAPVELSAEPPADSAAAASSRSAGAPH